MPLVSPFLLQVDDTVYDLRKVVCWWDSAPQTVPESVFIRFQDSPEAVIQLEKAPFEAAMQLAVNAYT
jgi:hypothetical protein